MPPYYTVNDTQVPAYLRERFITTGYIRHGLPFRECLGSALGSFHNESFNLWSHFAAALFFWGQAYSSSSSPKSNSSRIQALFCASQALVFTASFVAHTLSPCTTTEQAYQMLWRLDWSMIAVAILGVELLLVHYIYSHSHSNHNSNGREQFWNRAFVISSLLMVALVNQSWFHQLPTMWKALGALVPLPTLISFVVITIRQHPSNAVGFFRRALLEPLLLAAAGLLVYATHTPERWCPERFEHCFDLIGNSHNLHHVWTTIFSLWMYHKARSVLPQLSSSLRQHPPEQQQDELPLVVTAKVITKDSPAMQHHDQEMPLTEFRRRVSDESIGSIKL